MAALMKFWPIIHLVISLLILWVCWSLRQLAIQEVNKIVTAAVAGLSQKGDKLDGTVDDHEKRIIGVEKDVEGLLADIAGLATKADLARVEGEVKGVASTATATKAGVDRLEGYFLKLGVERAQ